MKHYGLLIAALFAVSCGGGTGNQNVQSNEDVATDTFIVNTDLENAEKVLETLPASHEIIAVLMDHPDAKYDASLLNSQALYTKYNTTMSKALNLGVYGVDMSYASLFNQNQTVLQYMAVVKMMSEQLGVLKFFDEPTMQKMEQNMDNKEMMIDIISTAFYNSDKYLLENGQREIAAMIISGAWIEAMYTAFELTKGNYNLNPKLTSRILKQCESMDLMLSFLTAYHDSGVKEIADEFSQIQNLVNQAEITVDGGTYKCKESGFKSIANKISEIRGRYVAL